MKEVLNVIHNTIYQFIDVCSDDEEVPMSDKDKLLLEVNKAICNNLKALEQQPCEDCTVIKKLSKKYYVEDAYGYTDEDIVNKVNEIIDVINELLSVTPKAEQKWIPCTERLPKHVENVLVCDGLDMFVAWYVPDGLHEGWHSLDDALDDYTPIIAWMPLPELYKAESEE